jgi:DNA-binding IclR family transcriptional regulator
VIGECGVAVPLVDALGEVPGALGLVTPASRWPLDAASIDALRTAARAISRELGAPGWPPGVPELPAASA